MRFKIISKRRVMGAVLLLQLLQLVAAGENWFYQVPEHRHLSASGAPLIHAFRTEPAFNHRDLFLDYSFRSGEEGDEHEVEMELEWALTDRLGVILELPYVAEEDAEGFGDLALVPRVLLVKRDRFLLSGNLEIGFPTGDPLLGFGNEISLAPSVSGWLDLGEWWTLHSQVGWERGLESGDDELFASMALLKTLGRGRDVGPCHDGHAAGDHLGVGLLTLIVELDGAMAIGGEEDGDVTLEGVAGFYYGLGERTDLRVGYQFPVTGPREFEGGVTFGIVRHF